MADQHPIQPVISRQHVRVPQRNKTALHLPPLNQAVNRFESNRDRIQNQASTKLKISFLADNLTLSKIQQQARSELTERALAYSRQYLPNCDLVFPAGADTSNQPIVMSGHQPELYHAGVWYKNFVLSELGERTGAIAINLVVDSDLSNRHSIRFPDLDTTPIRTQSIEVDKAAATMPHEQRSIQDLAFLFAMPSRFNQSFTSDDERRIVDRLWPEVIDAYHKLDKFNSVPTLGSTIAAGRHRLERAVGLKTLEVPISQLGQTTAFAIFTAAIFDRADEFREIYNQVLAEYRAVNRIRSNSHPVPKLENAEGWTEVPFWVSSNQTPGRQRLFIRNLAEQIELSDRQQLNFVLPKSNFLVAFKNLSDAGIQIRPRALSTTMFCRLLMSDIFIHGVGGAKYDQLTDVICQRFFGYRLPEFLTVSATFRLPTQIPLVTKGDVTQLRTRRREFNFHPERFLNVDSLAPEAVELIRQKRQWIAAAEDRSKKKHDAITQINEQLRAILEPSDEQLKSEIDDLNRKLDSSEIANSREYSFCLFGESLVEDLKRLVQTNFNRH